MQGKHRLKGRPMAGADPALLWELIRIVTPILIAATILTWSYAMLKEKALAATVKSDLINLVKLSGNACPNELGNSLRNDGIPSTFAEPLFRPSPGVVIRIESLPEDPGRPVLAIARHRKLAAEYLYDFDTTKKFKRVIKTGALKRW